MKRANLLLPLFTTTLVALTGSLSAATMLTYHFTDASASATGVSTYVNPTNYNPRGASLSNRSGISSLGNNAFIFADATPATTDPAASNAYHQFSFTVQNLGVGETLNLTSLDFDFISSNNDSSQSYTISLYSNRSGYVDTGDLLGTVTNTGSVTEVINPQSYGLTAANTNAGTSFTGLTNGTNVEFRFYFHDNTDITSRTLRTDNIVLNATVIPEPSTTLLVGLGIFALLLRRRR